jgi:menaquinone-dependent protoporphyrinogen oxidase
VQHAGDCPAIEIPDAMKPIAVLYATREGHTRRIADEVAHVLAGHGLLPATIDLVHEPDPGDLHRFGAVVVASPVHAGQFAPEVIAFARKRHADLDHMPCALLSVTLSEAGAERADTTPEQHAKFVADVNGMNEHFFEETGWHPARVKNVAGAIAYSRYNFLVKLVMKRIARESGGSTDTSRDHDYTDWVALDRFVSAFAEDLLAEAREADRLPS